MTERRSTLQQFRGLWPTLQRRQKVAYLALVASLVPTVVLLALGQRGVGLTFVIAQCALAVLFDRWIRRTSPPNAGS